MRGICLLILVCLFPGRTGRVFAGASSPWPDSMRVQFNTTSTGAFLGQPVTGFPLLVRLDLSAFPPSQSAEKPVLRATDADGRELPLEIEWWEPGTAVGAGLWVRVPQVDANSRNDFITLHWPAHASPSAGSVFDTAAGFAGVWHLDEQGVVPGAKAAHRDATPAGNHGDHISPSNADAGVIHRSQAFNGKGDFISVPSSPSLQLESALSISAWIKGESWNTISDTLGLSDRVNTIVRKGDNNPNNYQLSINVTRLALHLDGNDAQCYRSAKPMELKAWKHVMAVWDGITVKMYLNGQLDTMFIALKPPPIAKDDRPLLVGGRPSVESSSNTMDFFHGDIDELQISRVARSADWIRLAYENQKTGSLLLSFIPFYPAVTALDLKDWKYSRKFTFDTSPTGADIAGSVEKFPLLLRMRSQDFEFAQAAADGRDLRFVDPDGALLPHALERWDAAARKGEIWVKVPKVDGAGKSDHILMYWGNTAARDEQNPGAVFDTADGFSGAWHLQRGAAGTGAKGVYLDATPARNHGDDYSAMEPAEALVGLGQPCEGNACHVEIPSSPNLVFTHGLTFSAWIKARSWVPGGATAHIILRKGPSNSNTYQFAVDSSRVGLFLKGGENANQGIHGRTRLLTDTWYHVAATWGDGLARIYVNGRLDLDGPVARPAPIGSDTLPLFIGSRETTGGADQFDGWLDEVQASRAARSPDWIKLAYENQRPDSRLLEQKDIPANSDTADVVLLPGQRHALNALFEAVYPAGSGSMPVRFRLYASVNPSGKGLRMASATVNVQPGITGAPLPAVQLAVDASANAGRSLYLSLPGVAGQGVLRYLGPGAGSHGLSQAGEYLLGIDSVPPRLSVVGEGTDTAEICWIKIRAEDNVENLFLAMAGSVRSDSADIPFGLVRRFDFQAAWGMDPLTVSFELRDGYHKTPFPAPPARAYTLSHPVHGLQAPLGIKGGRAWDLVGMPVKPAGTLRMSDLAGPSSPGGIYGAVWEPKAGESAGGNYRLLTADDTLPIGQGIWMAGDRETPMLPIGEAATFSSGASGAFRVSLRKGWNQVTDPALVKWPWPVNRRDTLAYDGSPVKGLHAFDPSLQDYLDADSLAPWRGYFVHSRVDTLLTLGPGASPPAPRATAAHRPIQILVQPVPSRGPAGPSGLLRLGAATYAMDGLGVEDEPALVTPSGRPALSAARGKIGLKTDLVGYREGFLHSWKIVWTSPAGNQPGVEKLRLTSVRLPPGMVLRVASPMRKVQEEAAEGAELEILADMQDTLVLWAGYPEDFLADGPFSGMGPRPARRIAYWVARAGGGELRVELPAASGFNASVRNAAGRAMASLRRPRLAPGYYAFPFGPFAPGLVIVTVDFLDGKPGSRLVLKNTYQTGP